MKKFFLVLLILLSAQYASAQGLREFLRTCAWGVVIGTSLGVVSMAAEDKPGESWGNVAKGASLGLYGGIAYGLYSSSAAPRAQQYPEFSLGPSFHEGRVEGLRVSGVLLSF